VSAPVVPDRQGAVLSGGRSYHFEYFGRGEREPVCLLNGLAMSTTSWYGFLPQLRPEWDVLLYDYLGQGASDGPDEPYSIPGFADAFASILDAVGASKAHAVGISYGGFVAADIGRRHGGRLHTLTLSGILLTRETLFAMYQELSFRFYRGGPEAFELYTHYLYEKIFGEAFVTRVRPKLESMRQNFFDRYRDRVHALVRLTEAQDPFFDALEANGPGYAAIPCPVLILAGAEDRTIPPRVQRKILDVVPQARFEEIESSGHVVYLERPDLFWPRLRRYFGAKDAGA
jgi:pimeloyl-ACP methyl ester carboxylesterase